MAPSSPAKWFVHPPSTSTIILTFLSHHFNSFLPECLPNEGGDATVMPIPGCPVMFLHNFWDNAKWTIPSQQVIILNSLRHRVSNWWTFKVFMCPHDTQHNDIRHKNTQKRDLFVTLSIKNIHHNNGLRLCKVSLDWVSPFIYWSAECQSAECCFI